MKPSLFACAALTALACSSCASAPVRYYSLTSAATVSSNMPILVCCSVELRRVHIPVEVDRSELVTRRSGEELDILANDVWLAPLCDEIKSALLDRIKHGLAEAAATDALPAMHRFVVFVDVERFESVLGRHALMQVQWRVNDMDRSEARLPMACELTVHINVNEGVRALVRGHQQAIVSIANRIAANIVDIRLTGESHCIG